MVLYRRSRRTLLELSIMIDPPLLESLLFLRVLWLLLVALTRLISMYAFVKIDASDRDGLFLLFLFLFLEISVLLCRILRSSLESVVQQSRSSTTLYKLNSGVATE